MRSTVIGVAVAVLAVAALVIALPRGPARAIADPGDHLVAIVARAPTLTEGAYICKLPAALPPHQADAGFKNAALRILGSERRSGGLAKALGAVRLTTVQVGDLTARGRRLGATMLVDLVEPRRDLWATVPAYAPADGDSGLPYTPERARMHVAVLRDALIDIDLGRRRVIAFEPGPRSESLSWSRSQAPASAGVGDAS